MSSSGNKGRWCSLARACWHSWIIYLEAYSHSSSLLYRNHIKLSYVSQGLALKNMDYVPRYTVVRTCELYKWKRSLHMFFTSLLFLSACRLSNHSHQAGCLIHSLLTKSLSHFHPPQIIASLFFTKQKIHPDLSLIWVSFKCHQRLSSWAFLNPISTFKGFVTEARKAGAWIFRWIASALFQPDVWQ